MTDPMKRRAPLTPHHADHSRPTPLFPPYERDGDDPSDGPVDSWVDDVDADWDDNVIPDVTPDVTPDVISEVVPDQIPIQRPYQSRTTPELRDQLSTGPTINWDGLAATRGAADQ